MGRAGGGEGGTGGGQSDCQSEVYACHPETLIVSALRLTRNISLG